MKHTKWRFEVFSFFDYTGIAKHLSQMAEKGWMIEKIANTGWVYRKIEPQKLTFFVSYFPKASDFDPGPTEAQQMFHDFCGHTGWKLAVTAAQMQVFYNEQENPVPIETDPLLQIETIHAAAKKSFLPAHIFILLLGIINGFLCVLTWSSRPVQILANSANLFSGFAWIMLIAAVFIELGSYFLWRAKAKRLAAQDEFARTYSCSGIRLFILAAVLAGYVYWLADMLWNGSPLWKAIAVFVILFSAGLFLFVNGLKHFLQRRNVSRNMNRLITVISCIVVSQAVMGAVTFFFLHASQKGLFNGGLETYEHNGTEFSIYQDELPLTVEDLLGTARDGYVREHTGSESMLAAYYEMRQYPRYDLKDISNMPGLSYSVTEIRLPCLYEFCKNSLLNGPQDETEDGRTVYIHHFEPADPAPWQALDAYQIRWNGGMLDRYLLCYESRIIDICFDWKPTKEQMAVTAEKLSGQSSKFPVK